ncbi:PQQ-dependent sugar dehydrogenase [Hirschia litorea]|uniref:PQQ-dependent sugar dehydrogenase n=1 Tax=Hirschia litorea TaxID=1199156 RepID=A0ABW2IM20_9PROT
MFKIVKFKLSMWQWSAVVAGLMGVALLGGVLFAVAFVPSSISQKVQNKIGELTAKPSVRFDNVVSEWTKFETAYLTLERTEVILGEVDGSATGGGIDQFGDTLIYAAANGLIGFLDLASNTIEYSDVRVPMDYDHVRREYLNENLSFNQNWYRVTDILVSPIAGTERAFLYATHHLFTPEDEKICLYVSRTEIEKSSNEIQFVSGDWEVVSKLDACVNMAKRDWRFNGHMTGGRMSLVDDTQMLVTVGTFGIGNFEGEWDAVQADSGNHLGKIVALNLETRETSVYASGFRNPQGLAFDGQGRLWETEHAALSGDEVNLIEPGLDYGWPNVSYGFDYGSPRKELELNPVQGRHEGYAKPMFSFVPTIGISHVIPIDGLEGFELWDGDVLILSLKEKTIFRLRPDDGRIVYAEALYMDRRMRDGLVLNNGWIAALTGANSVVFIRRFEEGNSAQAQAIDISGYDAITPLEQKASDFEKEFSWGRMLFSGSCATCHEISEAAKVGPGLKGVMGRPIGKFGDYPFSDALAQKSGKWTNKKMNAFIANPDGFAKGTTMPHVSDNIGKYEREAIIEYLHELK